MVDSVALFSRTSAIGGTQTRASSSSTGQLRRAGSRAQCRTGTSDEKEYAGDWPPACGPGYCGPGYCGPGYCWPGYCWPGYCWPGSCWPGYCWPGYCWPGYCWPEFGK